MPHYEPSAYSILIASVVPLAFLYLIKWLNFYETHRIRYILLALVWGALSGVLSYMTSHPMALVLGRPWVATHTAPIVEEIFKSLVLLYLVRRGTMTSFIDGAVYGFAAGIGFAIEENMLYLSRVDVETGLVVGTVRAFAASVLHGSCTAIVGMAVAGFPLGRIKNPLIAWVIGLVVAIAIHTAHNNGAWLDLKEGQTGYLVRFAIASATLVLVVALMLWGLRMERRHLRKSLKFAGGVAKGEKLLVQHADDLDDLLMPIEERFGEAKREQVANALLLGAQLAMKQELLRKTRDPELRAELAPQVTELKKEVKQARDEVGMYIMSYVRSIMPKTSWSLWARLDQALKKARQPGVDIWKLLGDKLLVHNSTGEGMHALVLAAVDARGRTATLAIEGEEE